MNTENIVLLVIGLVVACIIGVFLYFTYSNSYDAFISYIGFLFLIYSAISMSYTLIKKNMYSVEQYKVNLITDIFALIMSFIIMSYFGVKAYFYSSSSKYVPV